MEVMVCEYWYLCMAMMSTNGLYPRHGYTTAKLPKWHLSKKGIAILVDIYRASQVCSHCKNGLQLLLQTESIRLQSQVCRIYDFTILTLTYVTIFIRKRKFDDTTRENGGNGASMNRIKLSLNTASVKIKLYEVNNFGCIDLNQCFWITGYLSIVFPLKL